MAVAAPSEAQAIWGKGQKEDKTLSGVQDPQNVISISPLVQQNATVFLVPFCLFLAEGGMGERKKSREQ